MQIMEFPDFPATDAEESYLHHSKVLQYLNDYADNFKLRPFITFSHQLVKVARNEAENVWEVTVCYELKTFIRTFDVLLLCPGRYSRPKWPDNIENLNINIFNGLVIHAHNYRFREVYTDQVVAVVGGGPSGVDISLEVSTVARKVYFLNRNKYRVYTQLPDNIDQIIEGEVNRFTTNSMKVVFKNASESIFYPIDAVIFATGYHLSFDDRLIDQKSCCLRLNSETDSIDGLYRHLINIEQPSMAIIAMTAGAVLPFPLYHQQVLYFLSLLLEKHKLPPKEQIDLKKLHSESNQKNPHIFENTDTLRRYIRSLEMEAKLTPLKPVLFKLFDDLVFRIQLENTSSYREQRVKLIDDNEYLFQ